jgi:hypothetical protein
MTDATKSAAERIASAPRAWGLRNPDDNTVYCVGYTSHKVATEVAAEDGSVVIPIAIVPLTPEEA